MGEEGAGGSRSEAAVGGRGGGRGREASTFDFFPGCLWLWQLKGKKDV